MNQQKIGKFICNARKEKSLTQEQLAEKLGVSSKSVSRWENGRNMPDLSLFEPLCRELGITVNELISGEKIEKEIYEEKFEENVIKTIDYTNEKTKKKFNLFIIIGLIFLMIIISFIGMFLIDSYRMRQNKPVIFSTWGYDYAPPVNIDDAEIERAVRKYIVDKLDSKEKHHSNEKGFTSFKTYLIVEKEDSLTVYAWVYASKFYFEDGRIIEDSGYSIPHKFVLLKLSDDYYVIDSSIPRDGSYYAKDIKAIFPYEVRKNFDNIHFDGTIEEFEADIENQAELYFHSEIE